MGIPNMAKWKLRWQSKKYKKTVEGTTSRAQKLGFSGTVVVLDRRS
jgi:hypothetical protein